MKTAERRVELLFEIGCEEIPAKMLPKAEEELRASLEKLMIAESLSDGVTVETWSAPRRLTAYVRGLGEKQPDIVNECEVPRAQSQRQRYRLAEVTGKCADAGRRAYIRMRLIVAHDEEIIILNCHRKGVPIRVEQLFLLLHSGISLIENDVPRAN